MYWTTRETTSPISVSATRTELVSYSEVFLLLSTGSGYTIMSEGAERYLRAVSSGNDDIKAENNGPSTWETFSMSLE